MPRRRKNTWGAGSSPIATNHDRIQRTGNAHHAPAGAKSELRTGHTPHHDLIPFDAHVRNLVRGADEGHVYKLKICASHFPMTVQVAGSQLVIKNFLGEKFPRTLALKEGATVKVDGQIITVESANKETAGTVASDIEKLTRRPGFDPRVFQDGIYMILKDGKGVAE